MIYQIKVNDQDPESLRTGLKHYDEAELSSSIMKCVIPNHATITKFVVTAPGGGEIVSLSGNVTASDIQTALREKLY